MWEFLVGCRVGCTHLRLVQQLDWDTDCARHIVYYGRKDPKRTNKWYGRLTVRSC